MNIKRSHRRWLQSVSMLSLHIQVPCYFTFTDYRKRYCFPPTHDCLCTSGSERRKFVTNHLDWHRCTQESFEENHVCYCTMLQTASHIRRAIIPLIIQTNEHCMNGTGNKQLLKALGDCPLYFPKPCGVWSACLLN